MLVRSRLRVCSANSCSASSPRTRSRSLRPAAAYDCCAASEYIPARRATKVDPLIARRLHSVPSQVAGVNRRSNGASEAEKQSPPDHCPIREPLEALRLPGVGCYAHVGSQHLNPRSLDGDVIEHAAHVSVLRRPALARPFATGLNQPRP